jgi:hypothetical protein
MRELRSLAFKEIAGDKYVEKFNFAPGLLPLEKDVLELMVYHLNSNRAGRTQLSKEQAAQTVAGGLIDHWIWCNVYTLTHNNVQTKILKLYKEFQGLVQTRTKWQTDNWKLTKADPFNARVSKTRFNIMVKDPTRRKRQEDYYEVKMTETEELFVKDQETDRKMFCDTMVDRMWLKTALRRKHREEGLKRLFEKEKEEKKLRNPVSVSDD